MYFVAKEKIAWVNLENNKVLFNAPLGPKWRIKTGHGPLRFELLCLYSPAKCFFSIEECKEIGWGLWDVSIVRVKTSNLIYSIPSLRIGVDKKKRQKTKTKEQYHQKAASAAWEIWHIHLIQMQIF